MNFHKMIEICLKDDNMHIFVMINALICINNYVITCIISMLSLAIQGQGMYRQGSLGGPTQQGRPNYPSTYPNYHNPLVFNNPSQNAGFKRNDD